MNTFSVLICILFSPTDACGFHLQSFSSLLHSTADGVLMGSMDSMWSGLEVDFGLGKIEEVSKWSLGGVHVESWQTPCGIMGTPGMLNKIHHKKIEHATSHIEYLYK